MKRVLGAKVGLLSLTLCVSQSWWDVMKCEKCAKQNACRESAVKKRERKEKIASSSYAKAQTKNFRAETKIGTNVTL